VEALPARLASVAGGQHALITSGQIAELKVTRHQRAHLLATGHIEKVGPHVYLLNGAPFTWQARIAAVWLAFGAEAVVSHRSAAALYSLEGFDQQKVVHLSVPAAASRGSAPISTCTAGRAARRRRSRTLSASSSWTLGSQNRSSSTGSPHRVGGTASTWRFQSSGSVSKGRARRTISPTTPSNPIPSGTPS